MPFEISLSMSFWGYCSLTLAFLAVWFYVRRRKYTRERFAFFGLSALVNLIVLLIFAASANVGLGNLLIAALLKPVGREVNLSPMDGTIAAMIAFLIVVAIFAFVYMFTNWDGPKSKAHYHQEQTRATFITAIVQSVYLLLKSDKQLAVYKSEENKEPQEFRHESVAWHCRAVALCNLKYDAIKFDSENYISQYNLYWGQFRRSDRDAVLLCYRDCPSFDKIEQALNYVRNDLDSDSFDRSEVYVAIRQGEFDDEIKQLDLPCNLVCVTEYELLDDLVDFDDYFDDVKALIETNPLVGTELTLQDTYTPSYYSFELNKAPEKQTIEQFIEDWLKQASSKQIALLGEYGQGKTTVSQMMSYKLIEQYKQDKTTRIPIIIELRGKTVRTLSLDEILSGFCYRYDVKSKALEQLHLAGRLLFIFEGFDEIDLKGDIEDRVKHFETLWKFNVDNAKLIITGRPNFFFERQKQDYALGNAQDNHILYLAPFNLAQIKQSLRKVEQTTAAEILSLAQADSKFNEVVARPSLLFVVQYLWQKESLSKASSINSAKVIDLFIIDTLKRQQQKQKDKPFMVLNTAERRYLMCAVAAFMAINDLPNQIGSDDLRELINLIALKIPEKVSKDAVIYKGEDERPLLQRYSKHSPDRLLDSIYTDVHSCGLLVTDASKDGHFKFAHKSYMELLQGLVMADSLMSDREVDSIASTSIVNTLKLKLDHIKSSVEASDFMVQRLGNLVKEGDVKAQKKVRDILLDVTVLAYARFGPLKVFVITFFMPLFFKLASFCSNRFPAVKFTHWHRYQIEISMNSMMVLNIVIATFTETYIGWTWAICISLLLLPSLLYAVDSFIPKKNYLSLWSLLWRLSFLLLLSFSLLMLMLMLMSEFSGFTEDILSIYISNKYLDISLLAFSLSFIVLFISYCLLGVIMFMRSCYYAQAPYLLQNLILWHERCKAAGISAELVKKFTGKNFAVFLAGASRNQRTWESYQSEKSRAEKELGSYFIKHRFIKIDKKESN